MAVDGIAGTGGEENGGAAEFAGIEPTACGSLGADEFVERMARAVGLDFAQGRGLRRGNVARPYAVALDVVSPIFGADIAGEHLQSALGGGIGRDRLAAELAHHGADVDDFASLALHHFGQHGTAHDVGSHEIHVDDLLELLTLHLMHGDALDDSGVVDKDVYLPYFLVDALHECLYVVLLSHVADVAFHVGDACLLVVVKAPLRGSLVDVVEDDVVDACGHERLRDVEAYAVAGSSDPGVLAFERKWVFSHGIKRV